MNRWKTRDAVAPRYGSSVCEVLDANLQWSWAP